jgi:hypothetical protein
MESAAARLVPGIKFNNFSGLARPTNFVCSEIVTIWAKAYHNCID